MPVTPLQCLQCCAVGATLWASVGCATMKSPLAFMGKRSAPKAAATASAPAGPSAITRKTPTAEILQRATAEDRAGRTAEATKLYQEVCNREPNNKLAQHRLAVVLTQQGDLRNAWAHYQTAVQLDGKNPDVLSDAGYCLYLQKDYFQAEKYLKTSLELAPGTSRYLNNLAMIVGAQGRNDEALAIFRQLQSVPDSYASLGYIHQQRGDTAQAQAAYREALKRQPGHAMATAGLKKMGVEPGAVPTAVAAAKPVPVEQAAMPQPLAAQSLAAEPIVAAVSHFDPIRCPHPAEAQVPAPFAGLSDPSAQSVAVAFEPVAPAVAMAPAVSAPATPANTFTAWWEAEAAPVSAPVIQKTSGFDDDALIEHAFDEQPTAAAASVAQIPTTLPAGSTSVPAELAVASPPVARAAAPQLPAAQSEDPFLADSVAIAPATTAPAVAPSAASVEIVPDESWQMPLPVATVPAASVPVASAPATPPTRMIQIKTEHGPKPTVRTAGALPVVEPWAGSPAPVQATAVRGGQPAGVTPVATPGVLASVSDQPAPFPQAVAATEAARPIAPSDADAAWFAERRAIIKSRAGMPGFRGFCPVTLRNQRELADGLPQYQILVNEETVAFASEAAMNEFKARPSRYLPVESGRDPVAVKQGKPSPAGSLEYAVWFRDRLYLFQDEQTQHIFVQVPQAFAPSAGEASADAP